MDRIVSRYLDAEGRTLPPPRTLALSGYSPTRREGHAAEAAIGGLLSDVPAKLDLILDAVSVAAVAAHIAGEDHDAWRQRMVRRFGTRIEEALDQLHEEGASQAASERLAAAGFVAFARGPDPLSRDPRTDIPSSAPHDPVPVSAGISDVRMSLRLADGWPVLSAAADVAIALPPTARGAHMSRLQQALVSHGNRTHPDAIAFAFDVAHTVAVEQASEGATVVVRVDQQPAITAAVTGASSSVDVSTTVEVEVVDGLATRLMLELHVGVMTACPCTLAYSRLASERQLGAAYGPEMPPTFTHSQPGTLRIGAQTTGGRVVDPQGLLDVAAASAVLREAVLKRPDEHHLVERAHRLPQFTEDLARSAAVGIAARVPGDTIVTASAGLSESIHPHSATAQVCAAAADLWAEGR